MEAFSALLTLCMGNSPVTGEFPSQRPVTRSFDVFADLHLSERLSKQSRRRWFEKLSRSLWRHCNVTRSYLVHQLRCISAQSFCRIRFDNTLLYNMILLVKINDLEIAKYTSNIVLKAMLWSVFWEWCEKNNVRVQIRACALTKAHSKSRYAHRLVCWYRLTDKMDLRRKS